jgi:molecular chaperone DnaK (HSP70)
MGTNKRFDLGNSLWSPEEISSEILKKIKKDCEVALGKKVNQAVITVPAYFDHNQRQSTKTAGSTVCAWVSQSWDRPCLISFSL